MHVTSTHPAGGFRTLLTRVVGGLALAALALPALAVPVVPNAAKDPNEVGTPVRNRPGGPWPRVVKLTLTAQEVIGEIAPGKPFWFWGWKEGPPGDPGVGTVPGPMIRVMEGDTLDLTICNDPANVEPHNIDFHAAMGPGGGAAVTNVGPGECKNAKFGMLRAGAYIYHCAGEGMPWEHVAHGMYGLIMVEPSGGLPSGYKEFYVGQSDWYLTDAEVTIPEIPGVSFFNVDEDKALNEYPVSLYTFNGHTQALGGIYQLEARQNAKVRFFFVTGGPNIASNWHIIGTVFDKVYKGDPRGVVEINEETVVVPPGSAAVFELTTPVPGNFLIVDHALFRVPKGLAGILHVFGHPSPTCVDGMVTDRGSWPLRIYSPVACGTGH